MDNKLWENACKALRCKLDRFIVTVKRMERSFGIQSLGNSVRMAATAKCAVRIGAVRLDIQAFKAFLEHYRIVIEFSPLNSSDRGFRNFIYMY
jgi:hypothetical protein